MSKDLSQGGSYVSPDVWAMGEWVELKVDPRRFSEDTARSPETVAAWRAIRDLAKAFMEFGRTLYDAFKSMLDKIADVLRSFDFLADEALAFGASLEPSPPPIRAVNYRHVCKVRPVMAYDRRPSFGGLGGRERSHRT